MAISAQMLDKIENIKEITARKKREQQALQFAAADDSKTSETKVTASPDKKKTKKTQSERVTKHKVSPPDQASIALRAWEIWQNEGCPEDRALEHWLAAEKELN